MLLIKRECRLCDFLLAKAACNITIPTPNTKCFHERQENEMLRLEVGALRSSLLHQRGNTQKVENQTICGAFNDLLMIIVIIL